LIVLRWQCPEDAQNKPAVCEKSHCFVQFEITMLGSDRCQADM
jgi:hypothetical protein